MQRLPGTFPDIRPRSPQQPGIHSFVIFPNSLLHHKRAPAIEQLFKIGGIHIEMVKCVVRHVQKFKSGTVLLFSPQLRQPFAVAPRQQPVPSSMTRKQGGSPLCTRRRGLTASLWSGGIMPPSLKADCAVRSHTPRNRATAAGPGGRGAFCGTETSGRSGQEGPHAGPSALRHHFPPQ